MINPGNSALANDFKFDELYHGTSPAKAHQISREGLRANGGLNGKEAHLTTRREMAETYAEGNHHGRKTSRGAVVVFHRDHPSMKGLKFDHDSQPRPDSHQDSFISHNHIPPDAIKRIDEFENE